MTGQPEHGGPGLDRTAMKGQQGPVSRDSPVWTNQPEMSAESHQSGQDGEERQVRQCCGSKINFF